jgi:hypothetical protein
MLLSTIKRWGMGTRTLGFLCWGFGALDGNVLLLLDDLLLLDLHGLGRDLHCLLPRLDLLDLRARLLWVWWACGGWVWVGGWVGVRVEEV